MVEIIYKDNDFLIKGDFNICSIVTFIDKEIQLEIDNYNNLQNMLNYIEDKDKNFKNTIDNKDDKETIAKILTKYYNEREKDIKENENFIKNYILWNIFSNFNERWYGFWNISEILLEDKLDEYFEDDGEYYMLQENGDYDEVEKYIREIIYENAKIINDFKIEDIKCGKLNVEKILKELFPMIDFQVLLNSIETEGLLLNGQFIGFEIENRFMEATFYMYYEIDENFNFVDENFDSNEDFLA